MTKKEIFVAFLESMKTTENSKLIETLKQGFNICHEGAMMEGIDYVVIGSSPYDEDCAQVGTPDYSSKCKLELNEFRRQLIEKFGEPPFGARLRIKSFPHDFGTYHELVVEYNDNNEEAEDYAFKLEDHGIDTWDAEAKKNLGLE